MYDEEEKKFNMLREGFRYEIPHFFLDIEFISYLATLMKFHIARKPTFEARSVLSTSIDVFLIYFYRFSIFYMPEKTDTMRFFGILAAWVRKNSISLKYASLRIVKAFL